MAAQVVLLDTGILIEFFRKKDKSKSILFQLSLGAYELKVAAISQYEIEHVSNDTHWNDHKNAKIPYGL